MNATLYSKVRRLIASIFILYAVSVAFGIQIVDNALQLGQLKVWEKVISLLDLSADGKLTSDPIHPLNLIYLDKAVFDKIQQNIDNMASNILEKERRNLLLFIASAYDRGEKLAFEQGPTIPHSGMLAQLPLLSEPSRQCGLIYFVRQDGQEYLDYGFNGNEANINFHPNMVVAYFSSLCDKSFRLLSQRYELGPIVILRESNGHTVVAVDKELIWWLTTEFPRGQSSFYQIFANILGQVQIRTNLLYSSLPTEYQEIMASGMKNMVILERQKLIYLFADWFFNRFGSYVDVDNVIQQVRTQFSTSILRQSDRLWFFRPLTAAFLIPILFVLLAFMTWFAWRGVLLNDEIIEKRWVLTSSQHWVERMISSVLLTILGVGPLIILYVWLEVTESRFPRWSDVEFFSVQRFMG